MRHSFLDRYHQGASLVHRLDPRLKLLATLAFVVAVTSTPPRAWPAFLLYAALAIGAILLSKVPLADGLKRSMIALPFAGVVALSLPFTRAGQEIWAWSPFGWRLAVTDEGLILFGAVVVKAWLAVMVSGLLVATTPFHSLLRAMRSLGVPVVLTGTISFMYRYLFVLVDEAMRMTTAREARSAGRGRSVWWRAQVLGKMIGSLFIRSYERSERIYAAMLSRGFSGEILTMKGLSWRELDSRAALVWGVLVVAVFVLGQWVVRVLT